MAILRAFALKADDNLTIATFAKLPFAFPDSSISTLKVTKARIEWLAAYKCPYCNEPRFKSNGKPRKTFAYVLLVPRLVSYFKNVQIVRRLSEHVGGIDVEPVDPTGSTRNRIASFFSDVIWASVQKSPTGHGTRNRQKNPVKDGRAGCA
ncbi:hypothetical protein B0H14DRAFT_3545978 [Mycena olivaceomarginata]|nr:hypothetical protein B0H14DRAFT_3545978 [Mycena olivaceomarginata]